MINIFNFSNYRIYLKKLWGQKGRRTGSRTQAAKFINCQTTYLSRVLNGRADFSLEQAYKLNEFLSHDTEASEHFLLLVQMERAGSFELKNYFKEKIKMLKDKRLQIAHRLNKSTKVTKEHQAEYYSHWTYLAIHVALSISELQTPEALKKHFQLSLKKVNEALHFLTIIGLAQKENGKFKIGKTHIHLENNSENILKHHTNWRIEALRSLERDELSELHYSVVYTLSREDALKLKDKIIKLVKENISTVDPSKEEVIYCNTIDFFEVKR